MQREALVWLFRPKETHTDTHMHTHTTKSLHGGLSAATSMYQLVFALRLLHR